MVVNCLSINTEDGPSKELFWFIQSMKETAPKEWMGFWDIDYLLKPEDIAPEEGLLESEEDEETIISDEEMDEMKKE